MFQSIQIIRAAIYTYWKVQNPLNIVLLSPYAKACRYYYVLSSVHYIRHDTTWHDTTKSSVNSHLPSFKRQAKCTFLPFRRTLSLSLSLAVSDLLLWIRVCQKTFNNIKSCRVVPCNVNRALFVFSVMPFLTCIYRQSRYRIQPIPVVTNQFGKYKFQHLPSVIAVPDSKLLGSWDQEGLPSTGVDDGVPVFSVCWLTFHCLDTRLRSISRSPGRCDSHTDSNCKEGSDSGPYFSVAAPFLIADPAIHL